MSAPFEIFLQSAPGLEEALKNEAVAAGFARAEAVPGGVQFMGHWTTVWRANLTLRGTGRVLARIGSFSAVHLSQLDKKARSFDWAAVFRPDVPIRVEVVAARKARIYHAGAAQERFETALKESFGATIATAAEPGAGPRAEAVLKVRIEANNKVILSVDTSGESLHKRGHKAAVGKAPMRETLAALFLRQCGYDCQEPVVDPMCGSGTFLLEAAEMAAGLWPGRDRLFAFESLASFNPEVYARIRSEAPAPRGTLPAFLGSDRDSGAVNMATRNAEAAGLGTAIRFDHHAVADLQRPDGPPGLVIVNPPYGARIGDKRQLFSLYGTLGKVLRERFSGWRVGLVTSDAQLARATNLPFLPTGAPVAHGGLRITLYRTDPLP